MLLLLLIGALGDPGYVAGVRFLVNRGILFTENNLGLTGSDLSTCVLVNSDGIVRGR